MADTPDGFAEPVAESRNEVGKDCYGNRCASGAQPTFIRLERWLCGSDRNPAFS